MRTCRPAPCWVLQVARYSVVGGMCFLLLTVSVRRSKATGSQNIFQIFFHVLQAPADSGGNCLFRHALGGGNRFDRVAQQIVLKHPLALCVWQTVQSMAEIFKPLHALDQFLWGGVREAGGILDTVLGVQRVVRLIAVDTAAAGLDVPLARQQFFRNFFCDFDNDILFIPLKIPQIDFLHCVPPFRCWGLTSDRNGGRRGAAPGLGFEPSWPEAPCRRKNAQAA